MADNAYAEPAQLREYLKNVKEGAEIDAALDAILERATGIVNTALGFSFAGYGDAASKKVWGDGTAYLRLPPHEAGSVESIALNGSDVDGDDYEVTEDERFVRLIGIHYAWYRTRYDVTAKWGYGDAPPEIVEVVLEVAVNIWRAKDAGRFSNVIFSSDGGQTIFEGALTSQQKMIIANVRARYAGIAI